MRNWNVEGSENDCRSRGCTLNRRTATSKKAAPTVKNLRFNGVPSALKVPL